MRMLIGGEERDAADGRVMVVTEPATGRTIDTVPRATRADVEEAIANAVKGQKEWVAMPLHQRCAIFRKFTASIDSHREEMAQILCREMGKPIKEARGDFLIVEQLFNGFVESANQKLGTCSPIGFQPGKEKDFEVTIREPLGVIACIVPFNGPLVLFSHKVAPALIAGNSVIVKVPGDDPLALLMIGKLMLEAGIPGNAFQIITGIGSECGEWLTHDPRIAMVSFTGSTEVGLSINEVCARNMTRVSLELGGNAPFVVMEDADIELAAREAWLGRAAYLTGQICNTCKRFLVHKNIKAQFMARLEEMLDGLKIGDPLDPTTDMGTLISEKAAEEVEVQVAKTVAQGARVIYGGRRDRAYYYPTILDNVTPDMDVAHNMEIFGPVFPIIEIESLEEAIALGNDTFYGLGAGIITRNMRSAFRFAQEIQAGTVVINGSSFYRSVLTPFGGYKKSGIGREGLSVTLDEVTQTKTLIFKGVL